MRLKIEGMTCSHCAKAVTEAVEAVPQVKRAIVDLAAGEVAVEGPADPAAVRCAIEAAGYAVPD